jgi:hypothetical protein
MTQPQHGPPWKSDPSYGDLTPWQLPPPLLLLYASTDYDMLSSWTLTECVDGDQVLTCLSNSALRHTTGAAHRKA